MSITPLETGADASAEDDGGKRGGRKKKLLIMLVLMLVVAGAAYKMVLAPSGAEAADEPEPGDVVTMEPIQLNLSGGHYLKIGIALQTVADVAHEPDGSKALDATIKLFSGREMSELAQPVQREKLKAELKEDLEEAYHGDVMDVYFTDFVTQ